MEGKITQKNSKLKKTLMILAIIILLLACLAMIAVGLMLKGRLDMTSSKEVEMKAPVNLQIASENNGKTVNYNGATYYLNEEITNILCIGVDKDSLEQQNQIGYGGQADSLFLAVLDAKNKKMSIIGISRDSMVGVDIYDTDGNYVETKEEQLCLSYAYGDGLNTSCENTVASVSRLLYGIPVHGYVAIDMDSIGAMTELVGGVTIDPGEDRKYFDFSNVEGNLVHLNGREAEVFVRFRDTAALESNNDRIRRQKTFLLAFANQVLSKTKKDITTPVKLYQEVSDEVVTNLSISDISYLASKAIECDISLDNMTVIQGEIVSDGNYAAFYPDETALYELILETYYYQ